MAVTNPGWAMCVWLFNGMLFHGVCEWYNGFYGSGWNGFWWHSMYDICCRNFEFNISLAHSFFHFFVVVACYSLSRFMCVCVCVCISGWLSLPSAIKTRHNVDGVGGFITWKSTQTQKFSLFSLFTLFHLADVRLLVVLHWLRR